MGRAVIVILLSLCLVGTCLSTSASHSPVRVDVAPVVSDLSVIPNLQDDPRDETSIAISRRNPQIVVGASKWIDGGGSGRGNTRVTYYYSSNGGQTWGNGVLGLETPQKTWGRASDPSVAADADGNFYLCALLLDNTNFDSSVYVFKSTDDGRTFGNPVPVVFDIGNPSPRLIDKCYITIDTSPSSPLKNTIYAVWVIKDTDLTVIRSAHRRPDEAQFSAPKTLSHPGDMRGPSLTTGPNGEFYAAWVGMPARALIFNASTDGGETFLPGLGSIDLTVQNYAGSMDPPNAPYFIRFVDRMNSFPVIDVDRSNGPNRGMIYIAWAESRNRIDADVFVKKLTPHNGSLPDVGLPVRVNNDASGADQFFPWLSVDDASGAVAVVFYDRRDDPSGIFVNAYLARSTDGGASFAENIKVSSASSDPRIQANVLPPNANPIGFGDYIALQALNGKALMFWADTRRGRQEIFFGKIDFEPSGGGGGNDTLDSCQSPRAITSLPFQDELDTRSATSSPDDPVSCTGGRDANTVWYSLTSAVDTWYGVDTSQSDYDTVVSVYTGACGSLTRVACNDTFDNAPANPERAILVFRAQAGVTYLIEASGKATGGTLRLRVGYPTITSVEYTSAPDDSDALRITGAGFVNGDAQVNVFKSGEPNLMTTTIFLAPIQGDNTATELLTYKKKLKKVVKRKKTVEIVMESPVASGRSSNTFSFTRP